nr:MAG TPA: hypothetical protein [Caudoviricetes sp.]
MAKRKTRKVSETRKEYNKQRKRIQNFLSRARKQGYIFEENVLPQIPKRITKSSVARLSKLTPQELYKKAVYVSRETGEIETPEEHKKYIRKQAIEKAKATKARKKKQQKKSTYPKPEPTAKRKDKVHTDKSYFTKAVIQTFLYTLETCRGGKAYTLLSQWFSKLRTDNGDDAVAEMLQKGSENGFELTWETVYNVEKANDFVQGIIQFLSTQGDFYKDEVEEYWNYISSVENAMFEESNFDTYD